MLNDTFDQWHLWHPWVSEPICASLMLVIYSCRNAVNKTKAFKKGLYKMKTRKQDTERALGKLEVSLGESGSFVGESPGFP